MNLKHGFYSNNTTLNPDSQMMGSAAIRSRELYLLTTLLDDPKLRISHLHTVAIQQGYSSMKDFFWQLTATIETQFAIESPQAKYANLIALLISGIEEFQPDFDLKINELIQEEQSHENLTKAQCHFDAIVTKIKKLRTKF